MTKKILIALILISLGAFFIVRDGLISPSFITESPETSTKLQQTAGDQPSSELKHTDSAQTDSGVDGQSKMRDEVVCPDAGAVIMQAFSDLNYQLLNSCLTDTVRYFTFETSDIRDLNKAAVINEIEQRTQDTASWITDQNHPEIISLVNYYTDQEEVESIFVLGNDNTVFAFTLDLEGKIHSVGHIISYQKSSS